MTAPRLAYGSWPSPVAPSDLVVGASVPVDVRAGGGITWWAQTRPAEGGRTGVFRRTPDGAVVELAVPDGNARTRVHEYGGGAFWTCGDVAFATGWADQRVYRLVPGAEPVALTPAPPSPHALRYADGDVTPDGAVVVCVRERHAGPTAADVANEIVAFPATPAPDRTPTEPVVLFGSADFVAAPRISPDGTRLAWLSWNHPDMPWTSTRLWVAELSVHGDEPPHLHHPRLVAGGIDEALVQPEWGPDGTLHVVSDRDEWWNVYRVEIPEQLGAPAVLHPVHPVQAEVALPAWQLGQSQYTIAADATVWFAHRGAHGGVTLVAVPLDGEAVTTELPWASLSALHADGDRLVAIAASATAQASVVELSRAAPGAAPVVLLAPPPHPLPTESVSTPRHVTYPSAGGRTAHAWFYPPANADVTAVDGELPPLLVTAHGGPTAAASPTFALGVQYWTTRGFAVADVDYGGSTGYGRQYRERLDGRWGEVDVDDVCAVVGHLAAEGLVDAGRAAVRGGSAGGFTVLAALATRDVFAAGTNRYGVADLATLAAATHKFESRYLDSLVGPWPAAKDVYVERSPISHVDGFDRPLLVMQGAEDQVVPPAQSELIVAALAERGVPHAYLLFTGEQHGFRQAATIIRSFEAELAFYGQVFSFAPADPLPPLAIT